MPRDIFRPRDFNKDSRLNDKDQGLEFKDQNQGLSTLPAFFMATNTKSFKGTGVDRILCINDIHFLCCTGQHNIISSASNLLIMVS